MFESLCNMCRMILTPAKPLLLCCAFMMAAASGQTSSAHIALRVIAEVEAHGTEHGRAYSRLVPADKVVPGDSVIYTVEVHNVGPNSVDSPTVMQPVPAHMVYLADSAVGPGADVAYSVDGGLSFDAPDNLKITAANGSVRVATAVDYTHIRWQLKGLLKADSTAFVRFRARVK
jgi:uncharacterized repeat protein (TIGR01451 family)